MKARIKKTGEIVDVTRNKYGYYVDENCVGYPLNELDFGNEEDEHWRDLRERAAIVALQGLLSWGEDAFSYEGARDEIAKAAVDVADSLIKELKKKKDENKNSR